MWEKQKSIKEIEVLWNHLDKLNLIKMQTKTDWSNLYKVRIANFDNSFQKHEVIKLLILMKIMAKHRKKFYAKVYTEHQLNGNKCDVYFEDLKNKAVYIYEIQKQFTKKWMKKQTEHYKNFEVPYFKSVNFIPINLNKLSNNLPELNKQLDEYIF